MSSGPDHFRPTITFLSLRAWAELRDATADPAGCDTSQAALVAAAVLSDVHDVRDGHGGELLDTPAGSAGRRLANELNSIERLALAAQRLGVEALTARLRHDHDHMRTTCADIFWHLSEAAELLNGITDLRIGVLEEAEAGTNGLSLVDVATEVDVDLDEEIEIIDLERPESSDRGASIDLRAGQEATPFPASTGPDGPRGRIVAAAMGVSPPPDLSIELDDTTDTPDPPEPSSVQPPAVTDSARSDPAPTPEQSVSASTWEPPRMVMVPVAPRRVALARSWRERRRELQRERALIVDDERTRGRGLRPRLPTWLSQGAATFLVCFLLALVAVGVWMLVVNDAGPF